VDAVYSLVCDTCCVFAVFETFTSRLSLNLHIRLPSLQERAEAARAEIGVPSLDTVFSQARNGRIKRVEESLNMGFPIDAEDEKGNTLLLVACQNSNKRLVEMLLVRGANINHQNAQGNTALHFALAFDGEGALGEYLIEHGADDTIDNVEGMTPYDGVAGHH
jgi:ankyrin repeat protein